MGFLVLYKWAYPACLRGSRISSDETQFGLWMCGFYLGGQLVGFNCHATYIGAGVLNIGMLLFGV